MGLDLITEFITVEDLVYDLILAAGIFGLIGMLFGESKQPLLAIAMAFSWTILFVFKDLHEIEGALMVTGYRTFELIAFLIPMMTIIEGGVHYGMLNPILKVVNTDNKRTLMFIIGIMSFVMSAIFDNITATIVMIILVRALTTSTEDTILFGALIIGAANAGGIASAIGNTTSILLWVGGQLTIQTMFIWLILPSMTFMAVTFVGFWGKMTGSVARPIPDMLDEEVIEQKHFDFSLREQIFILCLVVSCIGTVIVLKMLWHVPPYMGAVAAFGLWGCTTWIMNWRKGATYLEEHGVRSSLRQVDHATIMMFMLMIPLVSAVGHVGILDGLAGWITNVSTAALGEEESVWGTTVAMGLISSIIPSTPLVAASQTMFVFPQDHMFWIILNYTTGAGATLLPFGSGSGVVMMGKLNGKLNLKNYFQIATPTFLVAFFAGLGVLILQYFIFG